MASTARSGATLRSRASRQASTASMRRRLCSGGRWRRSARMPSPTSVLAMRSPGAELEVEHVTVEAGEVGEREVEGVALGAGGAALLAVGEFLHRARGAARHPACPRPPTRRGRPAVPRSPWRRPLGDGFGVLGGRVDEFLRRAQAAADVGDPQRQPQHRRRGGPGPTRRWPAGGPGRCGPGSPGRPGRQPRVDAVPPGQHVGDGLGGRRTQAEQPAARADRRQGVLHGGRAQQPHRPRRRLLDRLEQRRWPRPRSTGRRPRRTITCQRPPAGDSDARRTRSRVSLTPMDSRSVRTNSTSAWVPTSVVWQPSQKPQPGAAPSARSGLTHCRAAAKARAAVERPEPGGPVKSQAWVIRDPAPPDVTTASASAAAADSSATT